MTRRLLLLLGLGLGLAIVIAAVAVLRQPDEDAGVAGADASDPALVALGAEVYAAECAVCHGADLGGQPNWRSRKPDGRLPAPPHDETGHTWHHPDDQLFALTKLGPSKLIDGYESDMPGYEGILTDREIWAVLAYIKSRWPEQIRARQDTRNQGSNG